MINVETKSIISFAHKIILKPPIKVALQHDLVTLYC